MSDERMVWTKDQHDWLCYVFDRVTHSLNLKDQKIKELEDRIVKLEETE